MLDLRNINARDILVPFETETFQYNDKEDFYLNEREEKIWSYIDTSCRQESVVILQVMLFEGDLLISYSSEMYDELVRARVSFMANTLRDVLLTSYPEITVKLEQPIITNFELYEENLNNKKTDEHIKRINRLFKENFTNDNVVGMAALQFYLNGDDGRILGDAIKMSFPFAEFEFQEDGNHLLLLQLAIGSHTDKVVESFLETIREMGYTLTYIETAKDYNREDFIELMSSGLIEIKQ